MKNMMRTAVAALAVLALGGCAGNSAGTGPGGGGEYLRVTVENDGTIPTHARIFLVKEGGEEHMVGTMSTLGTETLTLTAPIIQGSYYLRAAGGTSYALNSRRVTLRGGETITWDMRQNILRLGSR
jgi:hypothetical protein